MSPRGATNPNPQEQELIELLTQLDRLEELLDEMADLDVTSREEAERRIAELNARVDALTGEDT